MIIAHVKDYEYPARDNQGAERVIESLAKGQKELGHKTYLITSKSCRVDFSKNFDQILEYIPNDVDIVHYHYWNVNEEFILTKPRIHTTHGSIHETYGKNKIIQQKNIIYMSEFNAQFHGTNGPWIHTWVDPSEFIFSEKKSDYFLFMAGLDWENNKGLYTVLDLAKKYDLKIKIAGKGSERVINNIKKYCNNKIIYLGPINGWFKAATLSKAKALFLLTQPSIADACPATISESLISGTPVIASNYACMPELIKDGKNGFICSDEKNLIKAVNNIHNISPNYCRDYAMNNFYYKYAAEKYLNFYQEQIEEFK